MPNPHLSMAPYMPDDPGSMWRPIDTAPKDGTRVLLYATLFGASLGGHDLEKDYGQWVIIAAWDDQYGMWLDGSQCTPVPTHWMPLPSPPV